MTAQPPLPGTPSNVNLPPEGEQAPVGSQLIPGPSGRIETRAPNKKQRGTSNEKA